MISLLPKINSNFTKPLNIMIDETKKLIVDTYNLVSSVSNTVGSIHTNITRNNGSIINGSVTERLRWITDNWSAQRAQWVDTAISSRASQASLDAINTNLTGYSKNIIHSISGTGTILTSKNWSDDSSRGFFTRLTPKVATAIVPLVSGHHVITATFSHEAYYYKPGRIMIPANRETAGYLYSNFANDGSTPDIAPQNGGCLDLTPITGYAYAVVGHIYLNAGEPFVILFQGNSESDSSYLIHLDVQYQTR